MFELDNVCKHFEAFQVRTCKTYKQPTKTKQIVSLTLENGRRLINRAALILVRRVGDKVRIGGKQNSWLDLWTFVSPVTLEERLKNVCVRLLRGGCGPVGHCGDRALGELLHQSPPSTS